MSIIEWDLFKPGKKLKAHVDSHPLRSYLIQVQPFNGDDRLFLISSKSINKSCSGVAGINFSLWLIQRSYNVPFVRNRGVFFNTSKRIESSTKCLVPSDGKNDPPIIHYSKKRKVLSSLIHLSQLSPLLIYSDLNEVSECSPFISVIPESSG